MTLQAVRLNGKPNSEIAYLGAYVCERLGRQDRVMATQAMNRVGFSFVDWLSNHNTLPCDVGLWSEGNTLFVAVYGTENVFARNVIMPDPLAIGPGQVCEYLLTATPRYYSKIGAWGMVWAYNQAASLLPWIERHEEYRTCNRVVVVGHSLGAAVGYMLAQLWYPSGDWHGNIELLTFGEPKCLGPFGDEIPESFPNNDLFQPTDTRDTRYPEWHPFEPQYHEEICCATVSGDFAVFDPVYFMPPSFVVAPIPTPNAGLSLLGRLIVTFANKAAKIGLGVTPVHHGETHFIDRNGVEYTEIQNSVQRFLQELIVGSLQGAVLGGLGDSHYLSTAYIPLARAMYNKDEDGQRTAGHGRLDSLRQITGQQTIASTVSLPNTVVAQQERTTQMPNPLSLTFSWDELGEFRRELIYQIISSAQLSSDQARRAARITANATTANEIVMELQSFGRNNGIARLLTTLSTAARDRANSRNSAIEMDISRVYNQGYQDAKDEQFRSTIAPLPPEARSQMAGQPPVSINAPWLDRGAPTQPRVLTGFEQQVENERRRIEAQRLYSGQTNR